LVKPSTCFIVGVNDFTFQRVCDFGLRRIYHTSRVSHILEA
jgi:hypothetical protein